ncbi:MAG: histidinol-phosphate aminotransferase [Isosphaeraceae bacterium]|jgi:histidinol-phosphate aminotransferase|nr:MAG: histidinol-phosphate aminotransferase [Isosphaeraceae bacterium]
MTRQSHIDSLPTDPASGWVLAHVLRMDGYVPGEQPRDGRYVKLNTNENPYPPSPRALEAMRAAIDERLRLYPDPLATPLREAAAERHGVGPEWVLAGNGSDDLLTILVRTFAAAGDAIIYPMPSYILYRTLAEIQGARPVEVPYQSDWSLDAARFATEAAATGARLAFLANPNSPSGTALKPDAVADLARRLDIPLVVDEAYADFAEADCMALVAELPNVLVTRSFSKGYGLAGLRVGYLVAHPDLVANLTKVKDSYNLDRLATVGAAAALADTAYREQTRARIVATRARLTAALRRLGYQVPDSQANFVWCTGGPPATAVYEALKARGILVRLMRYAGHPPGLRISVGTDAEIDTLLAALGEIVAVAGGSTS